jgi:hypothetical protein
MPTAANISRRQALGGTGAAALVTAAPSWARLAGHSVGALGAPAMGMAVGGGLLVVPADNVLTAFGD